MSFDDEYSAGKFLSLIGQQVLIFFLKAVRAAGQITGLYECTIIIYY